MDFRYSDEQQQLKDTLERFVRKDYSFEKRRAILQSPAGFSREVWKQLADMGVLAIGLPEEHGGIPGTAADTQLVMEALGRGIVLEPYLATVVLGAGLVARAGSEAQKQALLPAVAAGDLLLALAHFEAGGRYDADAVSTSATPVGDGYRLDGAKAVVLHGESADKLLVSARDGAGLSLFLVDRGAPGVAVHGYRTQDGQRAADVTLTAVQVQARDRLGAAGQALPQIELALDFGIAALCAEAVGIMAALLEATLGYLKTRKQFGVPIGTFQVLQHRMADMLMHAEQARSMSYLAAARVHAADPQERRRALSAAKALVGQAARFVGQQAVQLHGGIGVTDELIVSHWFKRLTVINLTFGDAEHHLGRFSDLMAA